MKPRGATSRLKPSAGMSRATQQYIRMVLEARKAELDLRILTQKDAPFISAVASAELEKTKCNIAISEFEKKMNKEFFTVDRYGQIFLARSFFLT